MAYQYLLLNKIISCNTIIKDPGKSAGIFCFLIAQYVVHS